MDRPIDRKASTVSAWPDAPGVISVEKPIFVDERGRRARALRLAMLAGAVCASVWLVALFAGALGFGRLPALPLPPLGALDDGSPSHPGVRARAGAPNGTVADPRAQSVSGHADRGATSTAPQRPFTRTRRQTAIRKRTRGGETFSPGLEVQQAPTVTQLNAPAPTATSPTSRDKAPEYTPSGNTVPAGTTPSGTTTASRSGVTPGEERRQR
jgi:hypothetical protein